MKKNMFVILVGVAALHIAVFSGLFVTGGCTNVVMDERGYVPAPAETPAPMETAVQTPMAPATTETAAAPTAPATRQPAAPVETFPPMTGVTSSGGVGSEAASGSTYTVKAGDTLGKIANAHGVSLSAMLKANNMDLKSARRLRIGQKLVIPASTRPVRKTSARRNGKAARSTAAAATATATAAVAADGTYTVKAGDTLGGIARRLKVKTADLQKANNLSDAQVRRLQIGQKLVVPGKGATVTAAPVQKTDAAASSEMDALLKNVESTTVTQAPAQQTPAQQTPTVTVPETQANPVPTAPAEVKTEVVSGNSMPFEVDRDGVTLEEFAKQHNTTAAALKQLNTELPADGVLKKGAVVFVPAE